VPGVDLKSRQTTEEGVRHMTDAPSTVMGEATLADLRATVRGEVITPRDTNYDEARQVWNGAIDRHPAVIARCAGTADVVNAVQFARSEGLPIAVRGGGHNVAGFGTCENGFVLDLSPMKGVRVDTAAGTVRAQGGVLWGELDRETQAFGSATTGGLVTTTGIAGFTLGGGIGWLMRRHGIAADNLLSADVVTADGALVTTSLERDPELLWALRGGGGNFGVVTSFEYALHPVGPTVIGGAVFHAAKSAGDLLRFYVDWTRDLPDELTTMVAFLSGPPEPFIPAERQGTPMVAVAVCHIGDEAAAEKALAPLRAFGEPVADVIGPIPYTRLQGLFDHSAPHGMRTYWKTAYVDDLDEAGIDELVDQAAGLVDLFPLSAIHLHHLEGAVRHQPEGGAAFGHRDHRFVLNLIGTCAEPGDDARHVNWVRGAWDAMQQHTTGAPYLNFLGDEGAHRVQDAYGRQTYDRLVEVKRRYDPDNVFRINQNIDPAGT
jgi:FAD/FMN-containing dehydrogenase